MTPFPYLFGTLKEKMVHCNASKKIKASKVREKLNST